MIRLILIIMLLMPGISNACRLLDASKDYPKEEIEITFIKPCLDCTSKVRGIEDRKQCVGYIDINGTENRFFLLDFDCKGDKRVLKVLKPTNPCQSQIIEVLSENS